MTRLTSQQCADIAITAAEGGIGYWSIIVSKYDPVSSNDWNEGKRGIYYMVKRMSEDGRPYGRPMEVNAEVIRLGYSLLPYPGDPYDFDAADADAVVQLGLFGDVIYS